MGIEPKLSIGLGQGRNRPMTAFPERARNSTVEKSTRMSTAEESRKRTDAVLIELRKIIQSIDLHSKHLVRVCGLTGPQLLILRTIYESGPTTASTLARTISLSQATVTGILDRLEKRGLLERSRSDTDRRKVIVQATPDGERLLDGTHAVFHDAAVAGILRDQVLTDRELGADHDLERPSAGRVHDGRQYPGRRPDADHRSHRHRDRGFRCDEVRIAAG